MVLKVRQKNNLDANNNEYDNESPCTDIKLQNGNDYGLVRGLVSLRFFDASHGHVRTMWCRVVLFTAYLICIVRYD